MKWLLLADLRAHSVRRCDSQLVRTEGSQGVDLMASCGSLRAHMEQCESWKNYGLTVEGDCLAP